MRTGALFFSSLVVFFMVGRLYASEFSNSKTISEIKPKIFLRTGASIQRNDASGRSTLSSGDIHLSGLYFFSQNFCAGMGYEASVSSTSKQVSLSGFDLLSRWYPFQSSALITETDTSLGLQRTSKAGLSPYFSFRAAQRNYSLILANGNVANGTSLAYDAGIGVDLALSRRIDLNVEGVQTLFSYSSLPTAFLLKSSALYVGVGYAF